MFVLHVALQGCLKAHDVEYGLTRDTGGHIRYVLDLVRASAHDERIHRIVIATRAFEGYGPAYTSAYEEVDAKTAIIRFHTDCPTYLPKEEMSGQVRSFAARLIEWIERNERPDVLHAHYADAANVCAIVRERLGIPFLFTAHSLGRVKQKTLPPGASAEYGMAERIAAEEVGLAQSALVIASSRDEAEIQYADYAAYEPGRIRVIPPGSELTTFQNVQCKRSVRAEISRFLRRPERPCLLAIARPVAKKNLAGLVEAYGRSAELRRHANLVLVAGTRMDIDDLDAECAKSMYEILQLIDRYDLYGEVAYPKRHAPGDIASYYAFAREQRGVFVNPALNEPFGLTLLEAAVSRVPVVATDSGGPNDIVETCRNGMLVDPRNADAIAAAALRIIQNPRLWEEYSHNGAVAERAYDWKSHARKYHAIIERMVAPAPASVMHRCSQLLVCDIDNTLVGCDRSIREFASWCTSETQLCFAVATGRSFHSALSAIEQAELPSPRIMITSVGSEIYYLEADGLTYRKDVSWASALRERWNKEAVARVMAQIPGIRPQAALEQREFKLSYFCDGAGATLDRIRRDLAAAGLETTIIQSHGRYLDILPFRASKGAAIAHVRRRAGLSEHDVFVAGDSGNDVEMLRTNPQSIIVANYSDGLAQLPALQHAYVARKPHALGVIEGVKHFRSMRNCA